jgi:hypothetical protein
MRSASPVWVLCLTGDVPMGRMSAAEPDTVPADAGPTEPVAAAPAPIPDVNVAAAPVPLTPTTAPQGFGATTALNPNRLQFHPSVSGGGRAGGRALGSGYPMPATPPPFLFAGVTYPLSGQYLNGLLQLAYRVGQQNAMMSVQSHLMGVRHRPSLRALGSGIRAAATRKGESGTPHRAGPLPRPQRSSGGPPPVYNSLRCPSTRAAATARRHITFRCSRPFPSSSDRSPRRDPHHGECVHRPFRTPRSVLPPADRFRRCNHPRGLLYWDGARGTRLNPRIRPFILC